MILHKKYISCSKVKLFWLDLNIRLKHRCAILLNNQNMIYSNGECKIFQVIGTHSNILES